MLLARTLLLIHSLVTLGFGTAMLVRPTTVAAFAGLQIISADGQAELITIYAGLSGALASFMLAGAVRTTWLRPALGLLVLTMTGITLSRGVSALFLDTGSFIRGALVYDIPLTLLSWFAFLRYGGDQ